MLFLDSIIESRNWALQTGQEDHWNFCVSWYSYCPHIFFTFFFVVWVCHRCCIIFFSVVRNGVSTVRIHADVNAEPATRCTASATVQRHPIIMVSFDNIEDQTGRWKVLRTNSAQSSVIDTEESRHSQRKDIFSLTIDLRGRETRCKRHKLVLSLTVILKIREASEYGDTVHSVFFFQNFVWF